LKSIFQYGRLAQPARPFHKPGDEEGGRYKNNQRDDIFRTADLEAEKRWAKEVIQAPCNDDGENNSREDSAPKGRSTTTII